MYVGWQSYFHEPRKVVPHYQVMALFYLSFDNNLKLYVLWVTSALHCGIENIVTFIFQGIVLKLENYSIIKVKVTKRQVIHVAVPYKILKSTVSP